MKNRTFIHAVVLAASTALGVSSFAATAPPTAKVAAGNAAFAADCYQQLKAGEGNLAFSPYSLSSALAMTYTGARGPTEREMASVLRFGVPRSDVPAAFASLNRVLATNGHSAGIKLSVANSLWCQRDYTFARAFQSAAREQFGAEIGSLDFKNATEAARVQINRWTATKTEDKIAELLKPEMLAAETKLVLCNAVYFKGVWDRPFAKGQTKVEDFFVTPDRKVRVPLMQQGAFIRSAGFKTFDLFELPYSGDKLSMVVILPKAKDRLPWVESQVHGTNLSTWLVKLDLARPKTAQIWLPKWKFTKSVELAKMLETMGMKTAFTPAADFSGMTGKPDLQFSSVIHESVVEVSEEGTEAAAATAVMLVPTAGPKMKPPPPPPVFRADHPFIFLIRDNQTGSILFLGRVLDPTK